MKKFAFLMATVGASVLTMIATAISVGACHWGYHQPKEPEILG